MAVTANLYIDAGTDYENTITVIGSNGSPLNLDGYTLKSQMRKSYTSSTFFNITVTIVDAENGQIKLSLTSTQSELIPAGRWLYDVEITLNGYKTRVVEGIVVVTPQITQT